MSSQPDRYYRNSGAVPFKGTLLMLVAGTLTAAVLSFIYALVDHYNPFIYVTFLATLVLGGGIGGAVYGAARSGAVRSRPFVMLVAFTMGLLGTYLAWVWFVWILARWDTQAIVLDPLGMLHIMSVLGENGVWTIRGNTPTGFVLYAVWLVEAVAIVGCATMCAAAEFVPYCEACGRWTESLGEPFVLTSADRDRLRTDLEDERYAVLDERLTPDINPADCVHVTVHRCPNCTESNYLSASHITVTQSKDNTEVKTNDFVKHLCVPEAVVAQVEQLIARVNADAETPDAPPETDDTAVGEAQEE